MKADVFVVDKETRLPIGRPWLTLALDVCSRMVPGFYLTMEAPSRLSTSLCLLHSAFDKSAWLRERDINEAWPIAGPPETLHADNGRRHDHRNLACLHNPGRSVAGWSAGLLPRHFRWRPDHRRGDPESAGSRHKMSEPGNAFLRLRRPPLPTATTMPSITWTCMSVAARWSDCSAKMGRENRP
jgi:transposase InsO family protein